MCSKNYRMILKEFCDKWSVSLQTDVEKSESTEGSKFSCTVKIPLKKYDHLIGRSQWMRRIGDAKEKAAEDLVRRLKNEGEDIQLKVEDRQEDGHPVDSIADQPTVEVLGPGVGAVPSGDQPLTVSERLERANVEPNWITIGAIKYDPTPLIKDKDIFEGRFEERKVAVKRILLSSTSATRELDTYVKVLRHPNIVHYYKTETKKKYRYIAIEFCQATLQQFVKNKAKQDNVKLDRKEMLKQASKGLEYLHFCRVVHRDIKPSNILISEKYPRDKIYIKLADFGLSKPLKNDLEFSNSGIRGTRGWIAPEVLKMFENQNKDGGSSDNITLDVTIDIFSMGCVFYYLLTDGQHPFGKDFDRDSNILKNEFSLDVLRKDEKFKTEKAILIDLIERMINSDPEKRPTSSTILKHPFFWRPKKTVDFILETADFAKAEAKKKKYNNNCEKVVDELEKDASNVIGDNWIARFNEKVQQSDHFIKQSYSVHLVRDLLRFLRNTKHHIHDISDENVKEHLGKNVQEMYRIWTDLFPNLVYHTWKAFSYLKNEQSFEDYYDNVVDFFPER